MVLRRRIELLSTGWKPVDLTDSRTKQINGGAGWTCTNKRKRQIYSLLGLLIFLLLQMALTPGLEPGTSWLTVKCSTNWAISEWFNGAMHGNRTRPKRLTVFCTNRYTSTAFILVTLERFELSWPPGKGDILNR